MYLSVFRDDDTDNPLPTATSQDLPGYSFGWWPLSDRGLEQARKREPATPEPADWAFLAVCNANRDLGLEFFDGGFLWATAPRSELARGDFTHLLCDGESS